MRNIKATFKLLICTLLTVNYSISKLNAQVAKTQVVQVEATTSGSTISLKWPKETYSGTFDIYARNFGDVNFAKITSVSGSTNTYDDKTGATNKEFLVIKNNGTGADALGYIYAGNKYDAPIKKGGIVLLIDSSYISALSSEIAQLKQDLIATGWQVNAMFVKRTSKPAAVKTKLKNLIESLKLRPKTLYIIGHVPVPYSGYFSTNGDRPPPDGHIEGSGNHTGAWPADCYYGDFEGFWTDYTVDCTTGGSSRFHNIPKDGKFDQSIIPNNIELEIGRVDMFDMDNFSSNDTQMVRDYLNRVHSWRNGDVKFTKHALIDNNFAGLNLASTGYHNLPCFVGIDSVFDNRDYFTEQNKTSYLWSYGCGAGSYNSCNGIGTTPTFAASRGSFSNGFTMLAGSFFGDWDSKNNLLRGALAAGSLASCWGGIPKWYLHHMGLGMNIGYGAKITINNYTEYFNGQFNGSWNGVFIALMGDPSLTMNTVKPPTNLTVSSKNGTVQLNWNKSSEAESYNIYRIDTSSYEITLARTKCGTSSNTTDTFFTDDCNWSSGNYIYGVTSVKIETTGSGTYLNQSMLNMGTINHVNQTNAIELNKVTISPNPIANEFSISGLKQGDVIDIELLNNLGQEIAKYKNIKANEIGSLNLSINQLYNGLGFIKVNNGNKSSTIPVVFMNGK